MGLIDQEGQWSARATVAFSFTTCSLFWTALAYAVLGAL